VRTYNYLATIMPLFAQELNFFLHDLEVVHSNAEKKTFYQNNAPVSKVRETDASVFLIAVCPQGSIRSHAFILTF